MASLFGAPPQAAAAPPATASGALSSIKQRLNGMLPSDTAPMVLVLLATLTVLIVVASFTVFRMRNSKLIGKQLTTKAIALDKVTTPTEIAAADIPKSVVGREYSIGFWLYLTDYPQTTSKDPATGRSIPQDKLLFYRGPAGDVSSAGVIAFMDGLTNKLYVALKTQESTLTSGTNVSYNDNLYNVRSLNYFSNPTLRLRDVSDPLVPFINRHVLLTIDYVPLQRWVHVAVVVQNNIAVTYMDGEIYSVRSTEELAASRAPELDLRGRPISINVVLDKAETGSIFVGQNARVGSKTSVPGFLSRLSYGNYAMSLDEVKALYNRGPDTSSAGGGMKLIGNYGLRNPVYRFSEADE